MTCLRLYDRQERNDRPEWFNEKDPAYLATFSSSATRTMRSALARGRGHSHAHHEVTIEVLMGLSMQSRGHHVMAVPASFHYRHVMRHSRHHRGMRVMVVVVILVRYGQRQEDHT